MGGIKVFKYAAIIEKAEGNYSVFSPDLPGCAATGQTVEEAISNMRDAIQFHIKGLEKEGLAIPEPSSRVKYIEISI
jgi:predicted RNase H-like HicB family nuclease